MEVRADLPARLGGRVEEMVPVLVVQITKTVPTQELIKALAVAVVVPAAKMAVTVVLELSI